MADITPKCSRPTLTAVKAREEPAGSPHVL